MPAACAERRGASPTIWRTASLLLSTGSEMPGGRGDRWSLRSRRLIRYTVSARWQNAVKKGIENETETPASVSTQWGTYDGR